MAVSHSVRLESPVDSRAEAVEQELEAFTYIVSHDLVASFRHVAQFSQMLMGDLGDSLTGRQKAHADAIIAATGKCQVMMEELLVFSRLQQKALTPVRQDATLLMRQTMLQLGVAGSAQIEISLEPLGEVYADASLLVLAFQHLLGNAIKFHRPDARPKVAIAPAHDDRVWRMRLADNGLGLEPPQRERAFRMFQRMHGQDAFPGIGSGLAICRRVARRHGGEVTFLDCDEGACVELALPRAPTLQ